LQALHPERSCDCPNALAGAIITRPTAAAKATLLQLGPLVSKYIAS
jgi:hypothetical protein